MDQQKKWRLYVSEDRMEAQISVDRDYEGDAEKLLDELRKEGINFGLLESGAAEALANREMNVLIARGKPPVLGVDDEVDYSLPLEELTGEITPDVSKDLRLAYKVPSVQEGEVIARLRPGRQGEPGQDIYGKKIAPPRIKQYRIVLLTGVRLDKDGLTVISTAVGRPRLEISGRQLRFQVSSVYTHNTDLTQETAHLKFDGDVVIRGSVLEGTTVSATGHVEVLGNVVGAEITAGQSVKISGNIIQGSVKAGYVDGQLAELIPLFEDIIQVLTDLEKVLQQLSEQEQFKKLPLTALAGKVIELNFGDYPQLMQQLNGKAKSVATTAAYKDIKDKLNLSELAEDLNSQYWQAITDISAAAAKASEARTMLQSVTGAKADVHCSYVLNSKIYASGNIVVTRQGSIHSQLQALGEIEVSGTIRGGTITAGTIIKAGNVGSEAGAVTGLKVGRKGWIEVNTAFENTVFIIGESRHKLSDTIGRSRIILDQDALVSIRPR